MHILIADDDAATRGLLTEILRHSGHSVTTALHGREALAAIARESFEVVIMDEEMPDMNGLDATRAILQGAPPGTKRPIIVGISGNCTPEDEARCLEAGMDAFLAKPVRAAELFALLAVLSRRHQPSAPEPAKSTDSVPPPEGLAESLRRATGGNDAMARSLVKTFLADAPNKISAIRRTIAKKDAGALASAAHALKGALALVGAHKAAGTARNLQAMGRLGALDGAAAEFRVLENELREVRRELLALQPKARPAAKGSLKRAREGKPALERARSRPRRKRGC